MAPVKGQKKSSVGQWIDGKVHNFKKASKVESPKLKMKDRRHSVLLKRLEISIRELPSSPNSPHRASMRRTRRMSIAPSVAKAKAVTPVTKKQPVSSKMPKTMPQKIMPSSTGSSVAKMVASTSPSKPQQTIGYQSMRDQAYSAASSVSRQSRSFSRSITVKSNKCESSATVMSGESWIEQISSPKRRVRERSESPVAKTTRNRASSVKKLRLSPSKSLSIGRRATRAVKSASQITGKASQPKALEKNVDPPEKSKKITRVTVRSESKTSVNKSPKRAKSPLKNESQTLKKPKTPQKASKMENSVSLEDGQTSLTAKIASAKVSSPSKKIKSSPKKKASPKKKSPSKGLVTLRRQSSVEISATKEKRSHENKSPSLKVSQSSSVKKKNSPVSGRSTASKPLTNFGLKFPKSKLTPKKDTHSQNTPKLSPKKSSGSPQKSDGSSEKSKGSHKSSAGSLKKPGRTPKKFSGTPKKSDGSPKVPNASPKKSSRSPPKSALSPRLQRSGALTRSARRKGSRRVMFSGASPAQTGRKISTPLPPSLKELRKRDLVVSVTDIGSTPLQLSRYLSRGAMVPPSPVSRLVKASRGNPFTPKPEAVPSKLLKQNMKKKITSEFSLKNMPVSSLLDPSIVTPRGRNNGGALVPRSTPASSPALPPTPPSAKYASRSFRMMATARRNISHYREDIFSPSTAPRNSTPHRSSPLYTSYLSSSRSNTDESNGNFKEASSVGDMSTDASTASRDFTESRIVEEPSSEVQTSSFEASDVGGANRERRKEDQESQESWEENEEEQEEYEEKDDDDGEEAEEEVEQPASKKSYCSIM